MTEKQDETFEHKEGCTYKKGFCTCISHQEKRFKAKSKLSKEEVSEIAKKTLEETGYLKPKNHSQHSSPSDSGREIKLGEHLTSPDTPSDAVSSETSGMSEGAFNLSDEIQVITDYYKMPETVKFIPIRHIKEFIKNLKWNLWEIAWVEDQKVNNKMIQDEIDKLAGNDLSK